MGKPAYLALIKKSGTPTAMVGEAMSLVSGKTYQITNSAKRVLSRTVSVIVLDDGDPVDLADIVSVDLFRGRVTFDAGYAIIGAITISATYIPMAELTGAYSYELQIGGDVMDDTDFERSRNDGPFRTKIYGLIDVTVSLGRHSELDYLFQDAKMEREVVLIQINPGGIADSGYIGWFVVESVGQSGDVGALEDESISFNLDGDANASFLCFYP
jgi:hypothetical protein